jgi:hypothetical protein
MRLRLLIVLVALLLLCAPAAAHASATVSGKLGGGWPASGHGLLQTVEALDAANGRVVASATAARNRYAIKVPSGTYILVARVTDLRGKRSKVLHSPAIKVTRSRKLDLPVKAVAKKRRRVSARAAAATTGGVTGIGPIPFTADPGSGLRGGNGAGEIIDGLLPACQARGGRLVDVDPKILDALRGEQALHDNGRTAGPYQYTPLAPTAVVTGSGSVDADGKVVVDIKIIDPQTGDVIQHLRIGGEAGERGENVGKLLRHIGDQLGKQECPPPTPPTPTPTPKPPARTPLPAPPAPVPQPPAPGDNTLTYSGTLDGSFQQGDKPEIMTAHVEWSMTASGVWPATTWSMTSLSGTFTDNGSDTAGCNGFCTPPCSSTFSLNPNHHDVFAPGISAASLGQSGYDVSVYNPADAIANSGSPASYKLQAGGSCLGEAYQMLHLVENPQNDAACWTALHPVVHLPPGSSGLSFNCGPDEITWGGDIGTPYRTTLTITSTLQFNGAPQNTG